MIAYHSYSFDQVLLTGLKLAQQKRLTMPCMIMGQGNNLPEEQLQLSLTPTRCRAAFRNWCRTLSECDRQLKKRAALPSHDAGQGAGTQRSHQWFFNGTSESLFYCKCNDPPLSCMCTMLLKNPTGLFKSHGTDPVAPRSGLTNQSMSIHMQQWMALLVV